MTLMPSLHASQPQTACREAAATHQVHMAGLTCCSAIWCLGTGLDSQSTWHLFPHTSDVCVALLLPCCRLPVAEVLPLAHGILQGLCPVCFCSLRRPYQSRACCCCLPAGCQLLRCCNWGQLYGCSVNHCAPTVLRRLYLLSGLNLKWVYSDQLCVVPYCCCLSAAVLQAVCC